MLSLYLYLFVLLDTIARRPWEEGRSNKAKGCWQVAQGSQCLDEEVKSRSEDVSRDKNCIISTFSAE